MRSHYKGFALAGILGFSALHSPQAAEAKIPDERIPIDEIAPLTKERSYVPCDKELMGTDCRIMLEYDTDWQLEIEKGMELIRRRYLELFRDATVEMGPSIHWSLPAQLDDKCEFEFFTKGVSHSIMINISTGKGSEALIHRFDIPGSIRWQINTFVIDIPKEIPAESAVVIGFELLRPGTASMQVYNDTSTHVECHPAPKNEEDEESTETKTNGRIEYGEEFEE